MSFRTIVLATDFSPAAQEAESLGGELARQAGATLHLVHVLPLLFSPGEAAQRLATVESAVGPSLKRVTALLFGSSARAPGLARLEIALSGRAVRFDGQAVVDAPDTLDSAREAFEGLALGC